MFTSQSSITSLFSTTPSGTNSNHFSFRSTWHDLNNFPCTTLGTLSCRFIFYPLCQVTFYIHLQGDAHTLSLFATHKSTQQCLYSLINAVMIIIIIIFIIIIIISLRTDRIITKNKSICSI